MKSERRHELQHNELAEWIIKSAQAVKPYQNLFVAVVVIAVVAIGAYTWWSRTTAEQTAQAWNELNTGLASMDLDRLSKVAEDYPDTPAGRTATVLSADFRLAAGCNQRFVNKATAEQELSKAIELYESDLKQNPSASLRERVHLWAGPRRGVERGPRIGPAVLSARSWRNGPTGPTPRRPNSGSTIWHAPKPSGCTMISRTSIPSRPFTGPAGALRASIAPGECQVARLCPREPAVEPKTQPGADKGNVKEKAKSHHARKSSRPESRSTSSWGPRQVRPDRPARNW